MAYLLFLNLLMLTRLGYLTRETPAPAAVFWSTAALPLLTLVLFQPDAQVLLLGGVIVAVSVLTRYLEQQGRHLAGTRCLAFLLLALAAAVLLDTAQLAPWSLALGRGLASANRWTEALEPAHWQQLNLFLFALLVLTNEVNLMIRYGFYRLNLEPKLDRPDAATGGAAAPTDQTQYNAGRVIGILERYFVLILLLAGSDYGAIAVILAAKGFARFKQLDRREFAEYVLIGTLASTLSAVLVATLAGRLLA